jgi:hypothetical protein
MDYLLLTDQQKDQISLRKLLDLESEHNALELNIRLAVAAGIENDSVENARNQQLILERQISILTAWISPAPQDDADDETELVDEPVANGRKPVLAR